MSGHRFHPEAEADLDAIWEFIAENSLEAADRMIDAIEASIATASYLFRGRK